MASSYVMALNFLGFFPFLPILTVISLFRIVNVLAPIFVKLLLMEDLSASMEVSVPTSDMMPNVMMMTVSAVRSA